MWYSSVSLILAIAIGMQGLQGVLLKTISFDSEELVENVSLSFEDPMDNCDDSNNENVVRFKNMSLTIVPKDFITSSDVRFITLEENQIKNISVDAFRSVPNLFCLNIRNNQIEENFLLTFQHDNLVKLNLANNKIAINSVERWTAFLPRLTHLDFSGNRMRTLPSPRVFQSSFPNLTHFYFSDNFYIPDLYNYLPPLTQHIHLERTMDKITLTGTASRLSALYINNNRISSYNYIFRNLTILSMRNSLSDIRNFMYNMVASKLTDLDLSSNELTSVPTNWFTQKQSVKRLSLDNNKLSTFPLLNNLPLLKDLSLNFNNITSITAKSIAVYKNLERLYLRDNRISMIEQNAFSELDHLEKLDLTANQLTTLPSSWILPLKALTHLYLRSNQFNTIDDMSVNVYTGSLKYLYLGNNNFTRFDMSSIIGINRNVIIHVL